MEVSRKFTREWFDDEVKQAIAERRAAYTAFIHAESEELWEEYRRRRRFRARMVKRKKRADWRKFEEQMEDAYQTGDHRKLWQLIDRLAPSGKTAAGRADSAQGRNVD